MNNNDKKPVLTICIPTRNRCEYLKNTILSIIRQKPYKDGLVEVIVADNASTDNTQKIVQKLIEDYNIVYIRNKENIGSEANYRVAIANANGLLIKLINDSIAFLDNSLNSIIDIINCYSDTKPQLYFSNRDYGELLLTDFLNFLYSETYRITALSSLSLWNDDKKLVIDDKSCDENRLWCTNANLKLSKSKDKVLIVNKKLFYGQTLDTKYFDYPLYEVFYTSFLNLVDKYMCSIDSKLNNKYYMHIEKDLLLDFFCTWVYNFDNRNDKNSRFKFLYDEDLHKKVFECCKKKPYYICWLAKYYLYSFKKKLKNIVYKDKV